MSMSNHEESGNFHDAIQSLLSKRFQNDKYSHELFGSLMTIEEYLWNTEAGKNGEVIKSIRVVLSLSVGNCHQWEMMISILTSAMEQRSNYDVDAGLTQTMTQGTRPSSYEDDESRNGMEIADDSLRVPTNTTTNTKISLVPTSLVAATVYAQLLAHRGSLAVGLVSMNSVAALANVINRWKVECCCYQPSKDKATKVNKQAKDFLDRDDDGGVPGRTSEDELCLQKLIRLGLRMARAVCRIPLQNEFSSNWKMEAIEVILGGVTTIMTTMQALVSKRHELKQEMTDVVELATEALTHSILVPEEVQVDKEDLLEDDEIDDDDSDFNSSLENLSRRHDITVATLQGLYPALNMKDIVPMGESSKLAAARLASTTLEQIIQVICADIHIHPSRWPKQLSSQRRLSDASTVPSTQPRSSMAYVDEIISPATPKSTSKHLRVASTPLGSTNLLNVSQRRLSLTPKLKSKTPAIEVGLSTKNQATFRPGPVLSALVGFLQQMATLSGLECSTLRTSVVGTIHRCIKQLPIQERTYFLQFLVKLCHSKLPVHRLVACELIGGILSEGWVWTLDGRWKGDWNHLASSLGVLSPYTPRFRDRSVSSRFHNESLSTVASTLFGAMKGRVTDRAANIRSMSATAISEVCRALISSADEQSLTRTEFLHVLSVHVYDLMELLRDRSISDDKATVRRASCAALVDTLIVGIVIGDTDLIECSITEHDIAILNAACQDTSIMVRRAAAEGLTSLIEYINKSTAKESSRILNSLEKAWATSTLPMVLDTETSCVSKAIELVERLLLSPILAAPERTTGDTNNCEINMAEATAWRILSSVGDGKSNGSNRSENDSLCKAIQHCMMASLGKTHHYYTESIFRTVQAAALESLNPNGKDLFAPAISERRTGVWCLFNAAIGKDVIPLDILRSLKKSKIDVSFLCTSFDELLKLFLSHCTPSQSKDALQHSMRCCLHVLSQLAKLVDCYTADQTSAKLKDLIGDFSLPPGIIGTAVAAMIATKISSHNDESQLEQYRYCKVSLHSIYQNCESSLSLENLDAETTSRMARILFTVGEISMVGFCASDDGDDADLTQNAHDGSCNGSILVRGMCERPSIQLIEYVQAFMTESFPSGIGGVSTTIPVSLRAHAFVALGKLCLRDANLAKQSLNVLARELQDSIESKNWAVQSNSLLVLGDLCVKYTNMVDRFLPAMACCLQAGTTNASTGMLCSPGSGSAIVRKHAILLLSSLILQDYVKWRGLLFHRLLVASVDDDDEVACLAEMTLVGPLLSKQPRLFANQFVESIFVLNCCTDHPIFKAAVAMGDGGSGISVGFDGIVLKGVTGRTKRMQMYQMMLSKMSDEDKIGITARIGKEVLGGALKSGTELNIVATAAYNTSETNNAYDAAFNVLGDALLVLKCPQIRVGRSHRNTEDDIEDPNVSSSNTKRAMVAKGRLLSNVSRKHLIEILMPILCNLKSVLEKSRSPLLNDLMIYLLDVYQRHKSEAQECLANDPTTLQEIAYDAQQQQLKSRQSRRLSTASTTSSKQ